MGRLSLPFFAVKAVLKILAGKKRRDFLHACKNPEKIQQELKRKILGASRTPFPDSPVDYHYYQNKSDLTSEEVKFFETTSGSTGIKKKIPYTRSLLRSFENMFILWCDDLVLHSTLKLKRGKFFMSVSPKIGETSNDDRKYLSPFLNFLLSPFLVSNPDTHTGKTGEEFLFKVSKDLISAEDLEVISIWSPTYLLSLLEFMDTHREDLNLGTRTWQEIWPHLKLISCWTHAQAKKPSEKLKALFPQVYIQPKGLLMTEAPVTIPWSEAGGNVPLLTETYLEFLKDDEIFQLHELRKDEVYIVLTSQFNGYLRYNTRDQVKVTGLYHQTPILEFMGREGSYTDLAGEKLSDQIIRELFQDLSSFYILVPDQTMDLPRYVLFTEEASETLWEERLKQIHHYDLARKLNQLKRLKVIEVKGLRKSYLTFCQSEGMNLGDIKEKNLLSNLTEARRFLAWIEKELQSSH